MAQKTNTNIGEHKYYCIYKTIGYKFNKAGNKVPVRKKFYGKNKKDAELKLKAYLDKKASGIETKQQYFGIIADNWIENFLKIDSKLKPGTKALYVDTWNKYIKPSEIYYQSLESITTGILQKLYNSLDCSTNVIKTINKTMNRFYKYLEREGLARNITSSLVIPYKEADELESEKEIKVWTDKEIYTILNSFEEAQYGFRLKFLLILAYYTGCRLGELLALKYDDFTAEGLRINKQLNEVPVFAKDGHKSYGFHIQSPKSKSSIRTVQLNSEVLKALEQHKLWQKQDMLSNGYRTEYLFTTNTGNHYYRRSISNACSRYYKIIGVEYKGFHTYRHTFGTNLCRHGENIVVAAALLGHKDINVTAKYYINVDVNERQLAVEKLSIPLSNVL